MKSLVFSLGLFLFGALLTSPVYSIQVCPEGQHVDESTGACVPNEE